VCYVFSSPHSTGTSTYIHGVMLLLLYLMIAFGFILHDSEVPPGPPHLYAGGRARAPHRPGRGYGVGVALYGRRTMWLGAASLPQLHRTN
jgi:hypothetical protein